MPWRQPVASDATQPGAQSLALRVVGIAVILVLAGMLVMWGADLGRRLGWWQGDNAAEPPVLAALQSELTRVTAERNTLAADRRTASAAAEQAQQKMTALAAENGRLRGDLTLVESLMPVDPAGSGLAVRALRAELVAPNQLHYVLVLGYGASKKQASFDGDLQLAVTLKKGTSTVVLQFPQENGADADRYHMTVTGYQRLDGQLTLPAGTEAQSVEVRLRTHDRVVRQQVADVLPLASAAP